MNLVPLSAVLVIFSAILIPAQSFGVFQKIKNLFSSDKSEKNLHQASNNSTDPATVSLKFFADSMGDKLHTTFAVAKVYRSKLTYHSNSKTQALTADLLLRKVSKNKQAYPFDYLRCTHVKITSKSPHENSKDFDLKTYDCKDIDSTPKGLDKEIVAQAAREYANVGNTYIVWNVLKAETRSVVKIKKGKTKVTLSLHIQLIKPQDVLKESSKEKLQVNECSDVILKYNGNPKAWTLGSSKFVTVQDSGKCKNVFIPISVGEWD